MATRDSILGWLESNWKPLIGYVPDFHQLSRGWLLFKVVSVEDKQSLLDRVWNWGPDGLILQNWDVSFNVERSPQHLQKIWVILPGLPQFFWQKSILEAIGNKIGSFVSLEADWDTKFDRRCAKIQVELDVRDGLYEGITLDLFGSVWTQRLDYWKLPFRCFTCRQVGHLAQDCPQAGTSRPCYRKVWRKKDSSLDAEKPSAPSPDFQNVAQQVPHLCTQAEATSPMVQDMPLLGSSSPFCIDNPPLVEMLDDSSFPSSGCLVSEVPLPVSSASPMLASPSQVEIISPRSRVMADHAVSPKKSGPYTNLRPRPNPKTSPGPSSKGGLAKDLPPKITLGRKSFLSKAQSQASMEVHAGKQRTIQRALGAVSGPRRGSS
jgi:hypothetical protein